MASEGNGLTNQVFLPGEFQGQRSLAGNSPWGHKRVKQDLVDNNFTFLSHSVYLQIHQSNWNSTGLLFHFAILKNAHTGILNITLVYHASVAKTV